MQKCANCPIGAIGEGHILLRIKLLSDKETICIKVRALQCLKFFVCFLPCSTQTRFTQKWHDTAEAISLIKRQIYNTIVKYLELVGLRWKKSKRYDMTDYTANIWIVKTTTFSCAQIASTEKIILVWCWCGTRYNKGLDLIQS